MAAPARTEPAASQSPESLVEAFAADYPFELDQFQRRGCLALAEGRGTLVAAPTGAGKTVVGEFAAWLALRSGGKAFYTTPLKALSNQKFGDFVARHGAGNVGLLTGDNSINAGAPVVVMTTEVLRNMLYEGSPTLAGLRFAVMDEVHYLQDRVRGAVWEEVLINLPPEVQVASLSATVSNAEEFGEWLASTRGPTEVVIEETRPVPLTNHYLVGRQLHPLFVERDGRQVPNPALTRLGEREWRGRGRRDERERRGPDPRRMVPSRIDVVDLLEAAALLPAIYFVFSRAGCDAAVSACQAANLRLTTREEAERIRELLETRVAGMDPDDLAAVGYDDLGDALERGLAAHHAGMLPVFREAVEELFAAGLVKVVFATETLSLGINMPARTVVIERLLKWQGERHELLTPGEYTQLTGRAGRRGIDQRGEAVVLFQPFIALDRLTGLASTRTYPLTSSFRPSYNMAVNLVANYRREEAEHLLASSFAQFLADRTVHGSEQRLASNREYLDGYLRSAACQRGDIDAYWRLRRAIRAREGVLADLDRRERLSSAVEAVQGLPTGSVIRVPGARRRGLGVVVGRGGGGGGTVLLVLTEDRRVRRVAAREFEVPPVALARVALPRSLSPRSQRFKVRVAEALAELELGGDGPPRRRQRATAADDAELEALRASLRAHPVHRCPDLPDHEQWMQRWDQLERETSALQQRVHRRTGSLVRTFDQVLSVLRGLGYVEDFALTAKGETLRRVYNEADLVVVEAVHRGVWAGLDAAELAAVVSALVYEARGREPGPAPAVMPTARVRAAVNALDDLEAEVLAFERGQGLSLTRPLESDFVERTWRWASGERLEDVLDDGELSPGDFVRVMKQLVDLLRQIAAVAEEPALHRTALDAIDAVLRGVVAYSSVE